MVDEGRFAGPVNCDDVGREVALHRFSVLDRGPREGETGPVRRPGRGLVGHNRPDGDGPPVGPIRVHHAEVVAFLGVTLTGESDQLAVRGPARCPGTVERGWGQAPDRGAVRMHRTDGDAGPARPLARPDNPPVGRRE